MNKKWKKLMAMALAGALALTGTMILGGCSSETAEERTGESDHPSDTESEETLQSPAAEDASDEKIKVAALLYSRSFEFMVALDTGIQDQCKEYGIEVTVLDGNGDSATQITQIEDCITAGYDVILLSPNNSEELVAGVKKANEAGVPVISLDGEMGEGCEVLASVTFDNYEGGKTAAAALMDIIESCSVLECSGATGAYHAVRRGGGFEDAMAENNAYTVIPNDCSWDAEVAQNAVVDILTSNPDVKAVFTHNGEMVRGVIAGLKQMNLLKPVGDEDHIVVVSVDGTPAELDYIREGVLDACIEQNPFDMGALAVTIAYEYLTGENTAPEANQYVYPRVINKDNVEDPVNWANNCD